MIQYTAKSVFRVSATCRFFGGFRDGETKAPWIVRMRDKHAPSGFSFGAGTGQNFCPPGFHQMASIWLLFVTDAHHVHFDFNIEKRSCECKSGTPLTSASLRSESPDARFFIIIRLRDRG